jgi:excisionase family DNA binding protein
MDKRPGCSAHADPLERLLNPKEVSEILNLRKSKIHQMLASGEIPSVIVVQGARRRVFRIRPSALLQWMKAREVRGTRV